MPVSERINHAPPWWDDLPPWAPGDVDLTYDSQMTNLRYLIVDRLRRFSVMHATHAFELRYRDPLLPYALAFLYAEQPDREGGAYSLRTATRLALDSPEIRTDPFIPGPGQAPVYRAARFLCEMTRVARAYHHTSIGLDFRRDMSDRADAMSTTAQYVGLALSSLDTIKGGLWEDVRERATSPLDVGGMVFVLLVDGTSMLIERDWSTQFSHFRVESNLPTGLVSPQGKLNPYLNHSGHQDADPSMRAIWTALRGLHRIQCEE